MYCYQRLCALRDLTCVKIITIRIAKGKKKSRELCVFAQRLLLSANTEWLSPSGNGAACFNQSVFVCLSKCVSQQIKSKKHFFKARRCQWMKPNVPVFPNEYISYRLLPKSFATETNCERFDKKKTSLTAEKGFHTNVKWQQVIWFKRTKEQSISSGSSTAQHRWCLCICDFFWSNLT